MGKTLTAGNLWREQRRENDALLAFRDAKLGSQKKGQCPKCWANMGPFKECSSAMPISLPGVSHREAWPEVQIPPASLRTRQPGKLVRYPSSHPPRYPVLSLRGAIARAQAPHCLAPHCLAPSAGSGVPMDGRNRAASGAARGEARGGGREPTEKPSAYMPRYVNLCDLYCHSVSCSFLISIVSVEEASPNSTVSFLLAEARIVTINKSLTKAQIHTKGYFTNASLSL